MSLIRFDPLLLNFLFIVQRVCHSSPDANHPLPEQNSIHCCQKYLSIHAFTHFTAAVADSNLLMDWLPTMMRYMLRCTAVVLTAFLFAHSTLFFFLIRNEKWRAGSLSARLNVAST